MVGVLYDRNPRLKPWTKVLLAVVLAMLIVALVILVLAYF
jgi:hypothetical protein